MFDPTTSAFIRQAPALKDLDVAQLPEDLARAFAEITSIRLRLGSRGGSRDASIKAMEEDIDRLRRLAVTYEAQVIARQSFQRRQPAAFVAATAHRLVARFQGLQNPNEVDRPELGHSQISARAAAVLLFLVAGYPSDAAEVSTSFAESTGSPARAALLQALADLASGRLRRIVESRNVNPELSANAPLETIAAERLWVDLHQAIRLLAQEISPKGRGSVEPGSAAAVLDKVIKASRMRTEIPKAATVQMVSLLSGPHNFASLLLAASDALRQAAVAQIPAPAGVRLDRWTVRLRTLAARRPLLWPNHTDAVDQGLLEPGVSAVVTFPTGAGKSTIAELKIAATLARGRSVVCLAPTHALVWQTSGSLRRTFPGTRVHDALSPDAVFAQLFDVEGAEIAVMTPERCLTLASSNPEIFDSMGLLVFDECHLMHFDGPQNRRGLDAMLCLLRMIELRPSADFLLMSAMISNAKELALWLSDQLSRPCLTLDREWKPTRQARGCVVYSSADLKELRAGLDQAKSTHSTKRPSAADRRALKIVPEAVFGLHQTWDSAASKDYVQVRLSDDTVSLSTDDQWRLLPNKNEVAATLARLAAQQGLRSIVFVQNKSHSFSIADQVAALANDDLAPLKLTREEERLREWAIVDTGGTEHTIVPANDMAAAHNGALLPAERRLCERAFERPDGLKVLVATPTLAQGMNLPAELVLIAGDGRFSRETRRNEPLGAHELLNAVGRAGRAGFAAFGVVLVIPNEIVSADLRNNRIGKAWLRLKDEVMAKGDQCLELEDPIDGLLMALEAKHKNVGLVDRLRAAEDLESRALRYFLMKVPQEVDGEDGEELAPGLLGRSLGAWRARRDGEAARFKARAAISSDLRAAIAGQFSTVPWVEHVARNTGIRASRIAELSQALVEQFERESLDTRGWVEWLFEWWASDLNRLFDMVDVQVLRSALSTREAQRFDQNSLGWSDVLALTRKRVLLWLDGVTLADLEGAMGTPDLRRGRCDASRRFIGGALREIGFACGTLGQVERGRQLEENGTGQLPAALGTLGTCLQEGFDNPIALAVRRAVGPLVARRLCIRWADALGIEFDGTRVESSFQDLCSLVRDRIEVVRGEDHQFELNL